MAAGVTIRAGDTGLFAAFLEARLAEAVDDARASDMLAVDATLTRRRRRGGHRRRARARRAVRLGTARAGFRLSASPPDRGEGSRQRRPYPHQVARRRRDHYRGRCLSRRGPTARQCPDASIGHDLHVAGTLSIDRWGGKEKVEIRILDARPARRPHFRRPVHARPFVAAGTAHADPARRLTARRVADANSACRPFEPLYMSAGQRRRAPDHAPRAGVFMRSSSIG